MKGLFVRLLLTMIWSLTFLPRMSFSLIPHYTQVVHTSLAMYILHSKLHITHAQFFGGKDMFASLSLPLWGGGKSESESDSNAKKSAPPTSGVSQTFNTDFSLRSVDISPNDSQACISSDSRDAYYKMGIEEEEAKVLEQLCIKFLHSIQQSIHYVAEVCYFSSSRFVDLLKSVPQNAGRPFRTASSYLDSAAIRLDPGRIEIDAIPRGVQDSMYDIKGKSTTEIGTDETKSEERRGSNDLEIVLLQHKRSLTRTVHRISLGFQRGLKRLSTVISTLSNVSRFIEWQCDRVEHMIDSFTSLIADIVKDLFASFDRCLFTSLQHATIFLLQPPKLRVSSTSSNVELSTSSAQNGETPTFPRPLYGDDSRATSKSACNQDIINGETGKDKSRPRGIIRLDALGNYQRRYIGHYGPISEAKSTTFRSPSSVPANTAASSRMQGRKSGGLFAPSKDKGSSYGNEGVIKRPHKLSQSPLKNQADVPAIDSLSTATLFASKAPQTTTPQEEVPSDSPGTSGSSHFFSPFSVFTAAVGPANTPSFSPFTQFPTSTPIPALAPTNNPQSKPASTSDIPAMSAPASKSSAPQSFVSSSPAYTVPFSSSHSAFSPPSSTLASPVPAIVKELSFMWFKSIYGQNTFEQALLPNTPSIVPQLFISLAIVAFVSSRKYSSIWTQFFCTGLCIAVIFISLVALDRVVRAKIAHICGIEAVNLFVSGKRGASLLSTNKSNINPSTISPSVIDSIDFEISPWVNTFLASFWTVSSANGGLGPYISQSMKDVLVTELAKVPPDVANLELQRFTLGTNAPVIRSVRVDSYLAPLCLSLVEQYAFLKRINSNLPQGHKKYTILDFLDHESLPPGLSSIGKDGKMGNNKGGNTVINDRMKLKILELFERHGRLNTSSEPFPLSGKSRSRSNIKYGNVLKNKNSSPTSTSHSSTSSSHPPSSSFFTSSATMSGDGKLPSPHCERLVFDFDTSYVSKDMDIVFRFRANDVNSMLPEATVTVSEVAIAAIMRFDAELLPDYPFIGNATITFLELPTLDIAISSFGGIDISSIPGVYSWIKITITWLLGQCTSPSFASMDLKEWLCPTCNEESSSDQKTSPKLINILADLLRETGNAFKSVFAFLSRYLERNHI